MTYFNLTRIAAAIAGLAVAAATQAQTQTPAQNQGGAMPPAAAASGGQGDMAAPGALTPPPGDPRNAPPDGPPNLPPGATEGPVPVLVPELFMMTLPRTEVTGVMPNPAGMPDLKYANTRVVPETAFGFLGPVEVLRGFDSLLGSPPLPNGFNYRGAELNVMGGSFGRAQVFTQGGRQSGDLSFFGAFGGLKDDGWQQHSPARSMQFHGDAGYRSGGNEFHLIGHYLSNNIKGGMVTPVELLATDRTAQSAHPVENDLQNIKLDFTGKIALDDGWIANTDFSVGKFNGKQEFTLESESQIGACMGMPSLLCSKVFGAPYLGVNGQQFVNVLQGSTDRYYGYNDHLKTDTKSVAASGRLAKRGMLLGRPNHFAAGVTYNGGKSTGGYRHRVAVLNADGGLESILGEANFAPFVVPQEVSANVDYTNLYVTDVLDISPKFKVAASGRYTHSRIEQKDLMGTSPQLNETRTFTHFAPSAGATYALTPGLLAYGGYQETARVVTPFGVSCEDGDSVCNAETPWFAADSILDQSIVKNHQIGVRGQSPNFSVAGNSIQVGWNAGLYRKDTSHYYYLAPSSSRPQANDVGDIRVEGAKLGMEIVAGKLTTSVNYTYADARFRSPVVLGNGVNQESVNFQLHVSPGKVIPGQARHALNLAVKYDVTNAWSIGTSFRAVSSSYYFADEVNAMGKVPGYVVTSFNTNYRVNKNLELFGIIQNAFDKEYATFGSLVPTSHNTSDSHGWMIGQPLSVYAGLRYKF